MTDDCLSCPAFHYSKYDSAKELVNRNWCGGPEQTKISSLLTNGLHYRLAFHMFLNGIMSHRAGVMLHEANKH